MFRKKKCLRCRGKVSDKFDFCPHCGFPMKKGKEGEDDFGMLGKNDFAEESLLPEPFFGGIMGGGILGKMLNNTMKMLEKELQKEVKNEEAGNIPFGKTSFELFINGKRIDPKNIKVSQTPMIPASHLSGKNQSPAPKKIKEIQPNVFSKEQTKKFSELAREEPKTLTVRRFSNRVIYEIEMPEVKSTDDVSIMRLEKSIEIRAVGKTKSYFKILQVGLPVVNYTLEDGKLILELGEGN